jgi:hypothetical protein
VNKYFKSKIKGIDGYKEKRREREREEERERDRKKGDKEKEEEGREKVSYSSFGNRSKLTGSESLCSLLSNKGEMNG